MPAGEQRHTALAGQGYEGLYFGDRRAWGLFEEHVLSRQQSFAGRIEARLWRLAQNDPIEVRLALKQCRQVRIIPQPLCLGVAAGHGHQFGTCGLGNGGEVLIASNLTQADEA